MTGSQYRPDPVANQDQVVRLIPAPSDLAASADELAVLSLAYGTPVTSFAFTLSWEMAGDKLRPIFEFEQSPLGGAAFAVELVFQNGEARVFEFGSATSDAEALTPLKAVEPCADEAAWITGATIIADSQPLRIVFTYDAGADESSLRSMIETG